MTDLSAFLNDPFAFLDNGETAFFDEGTEPSGTNVDLLNFAYEDDSFGMLEGITREARRVLENTPTGFGRALLKFGDAALIDLLKNGPMSIRNKCNGEIIDYRDLRFNEMNQLDCLPILLHIFAGHDIELGDKELAIPAITITPQMFCASFVLRMAFNTTYCIWDGELKTYYRMQASAAFGVMQSLTPVGDNSISDAVASSLKSVAAKQSASNRWARLDDAKKLAFKRREDHAGLSRSAAIDKFLPDVIETCRAAGEPLTGGDPKRTVTDWFRKAGIK